VYISADTAPQHRIRGRDPAVVKQLKYKENLLPIPGSSQGRSASGARHHSQSYAQPAQVEPKSEYKNNAIVHTVCIYGSRAATRLSNLAKIKVA
jgi:hypothetical protein